MSPLSTCLGIVSSGFAALVLRPVNSYQGFMVKSTATANTPALAVMASATTLLGLKRRSAFATLAGVFSAGAAAWYIRSVTAPHDAFERAFGPEWRRQIPPDIEQRMLQRRLTWRLPVVPEPRWTRDVPFCTIPDTGRQLLADIWQPPAGVEPNGTAIVYLYGGSWHFFDKDVLTRPFFRQLAALGYVIVDAGHRSCPETDVSGMVGDVHRAVAWIKANAGTYGVNRERIVVMGGSSGAHIALLAAYAPHDPRLAPPDLDGVDTSVMAVVSYYGIPDMYSAYARWKHQETASPRPSAGSTQQKPGPLADRVTKLMLGRTLTVAQSPPGPNVDDLIRNLLGGLPDEVPDMFDLASPMYQVTSSSPPTLIFQGTHDAVVPLPAARRLQRTLEDAGVPVVYIEYPATEHAFDLMYPPLANPAARAALYDLERFLVLVANTRGRPERSPVTERQYASLRMAETASV